jgi:hypothetical protein
LTFYIIPNVSLDLLYYFPSPTSLSPTLRTARRRCIAEPTSTTKEPTKLFCLSNREQKRQDSEALTDLSANKMSFPRLPKEQNDKLMALGKELQGGVGYAYPGMDEVVKNARSVCKILDWHWIEKAAEKAGIAKLVFNPDLFEENTWFSLGFLFQYANRYLVSINQPSFMFLRYAVMCFNDGYGSKQWKYTTNDQEWMSCQINEGPQIRALCERIGQDVLKEALENYEEPELTVNERVGLI